MERSISTKCIHLEGERKGGHFGAVSYPIYQTATYVHEGVGRSTGYDYSRLQNPTREQLEKIVASLEKGVDALAYSTGMAAIAALMELFRPGDHLIVEADLYGGSIRLFDNVSKKNGLSFTSLDCSREDVEACITEKTRAIYIETPTNPMMNVTDIAKLSRIAKAHGLWLIVDNDTLAGFLVTSSLEISSRLRFLIKTTGAGLAPFDSWLVIRGIKTLAVRMEKAQANAREIAGWLLGQQAVKKVIYPGLESHPGYEIMRRQSRGFGAMLTFEVESREFALSILEKVRLIQYAESLGGAETLITYPQTQTHADVPEEIRERNGITERVLRLSVGIEDVKDLIGELQEVFHRTEEELYGGEKS